MMATNTISAELSRASRHVEILSESGDQRHYVQVQSELSALSDRITRESAFTYIDEFSRINDVFQQIPKPGSRSGMGSRQVEPSPSSASKQAPPKITLERQFGTISQFSGALFAKKYRETCPSTSLSFISCFLNNGPDGMMTSQTIDKVIRIGQDRFVLLSNAREGNKHLIPESLREETQGIRMSPFDAIPAFSDSIGELPHSPKSFVLATDLGERRGQLQEFLQGLVVQAGKNRHGRAGSTITVNGQTLGIGVEVKGQEVSIMLFDSHGNELNPSPNGFIMKTNNVRQAALTLGNMLYIKNPDMSAERTKLLLQGYSEEEIEFLLTPPKDLNEASFMIVLPKDNLVEFPPKARVERELPMDREEKKEAKSSSQSSVSFELAGNDDPLPIPQLPQQQREASTDKISGDVPDTSASAARRESVVSSAQSAALNIDDFHLMGGLNDPSSLSRGGGSSGDQGSSNENCVIS